MSILKPDSVLRNRKREILVINEHAYPLFADRYPGSSHHRSLGLLKIFRGAIRAPGVVVIGYWTSRILGSYPMGSCTNHASKLAYLCQLSERS